MKEFYSEFYIAQVPTIVLKLEIYLINTNEIR